MGLERRKLLQATGVGGLLSLAGCIATPSDGEESDGGGSSENSSDTGDQEDQSDEPEVVTASDVLQSRVSEIAQYTSWITGMEYSGAYREYGDAIDAAVEEFKTLESTPYADLAVRDIDSLMNIIESAQSIAYDSFGEYYDIHFAWKSYIDDVETDLKNGIRRNEKELFNEKLIDHRRQMADLRDIEYFYPNNFVDRSPYELFFKSEDAVSDGFIFEALSIDSADDGYIAVSETDTRIQQSPFGFELSDDSDWSQGIGTYDRESTLRENASWFMRPEAAESQMLFNIIDYTAVDDDYPDDYTYDERSRSQVELVDLNQTDPIGVVMQTFADEEAAVNAYDAIAAEGESEGMSTLLGVEYQRFFKIGEDNTYYVSLIRLGSIILGIDPVIVPWDVREVVPSNGDEPVSVSERLKSTFVDLSEYEPDSDPEE